LKRQALGSLNPNNKMKKLIFLLLPAITLAQSNFTADGRHLLLPIEKVPIIWRDLQNGKECEFEVKRKQVAIDTLSAIVTTMAAEQKQHISWINDLSNQRDSLLEQAAAKELNTAVAVDRKKWYRSPWLYLAIGAVGGGWIVNSVK